MRSSGPCSAHNVPLRQANATSCLILFSVVAARIRYRLGRGGLRWLDARRRGVAQIQRPLLPPAGEQRDRHAEKKEKHKILMLAPMNETDFEALAGAALAKIEQALEASGVDADFELKGGGVLEIEFADGSKMVINRHGAAREIWVAARAGGFHFRWDGAAWRDTREGTELFAALSKIVSTQSGQAVLLRP